jgi:hypothetical protein
MTGRVNKVSDFWPQYPNTAKVGSRADTKLRCQDFQRVSRERVLNLRFCNNSQDFHHQLSLVVTTFLPCLHPFYLNLSKTSVHMWLNGYSVNQTVITYAVNKERNIVIWLVSTLFMLLTFCQTISVSVLAIKYFVKLFEFQWERIVLLPLLIFWRFFFCTAMNLNVWLKSKKTLQSTR